MSLLVSILQELPDLVVFAVGIVVFAYLCKKVLVTDKHRKPAVKIVRDILIGAVGGCNCSDKYKWGDRFCWYKFGLYRGDGCYFCSLFWRVSQVHACSDKRLTF